LGGQSRGFAGALPDELRKPDGRDLTALDLMLYGPLVTAQRLVTARARQPAFLEIQQQVYLPGLETVAPHLSLQKFFHQPVEAIDQQFQIRRISHTLFLSANGG
jgi:hypothetical protein